MFHSKLVTLKGLLKFLLRFTYSRFHQNLLYCESKKCPPRSWINFEIDKMDRGESPFNFRAGKKELFLIHTFLSHAHIHPLFPHTHMLIGRVQSFSQVSLYLFPIASILLITFCLLYRVLSLILSFI